MFSDLQNQRAEYERIVSTPVPTMLDWMAGKTQEPAKESTTTIACRFGDIIILGPDRFIIAEFAQYGGSGYHCDTSDLSSIEAILNRPDWTELEINEAVAKINEEDAQ